MKLKAYTTPLKKWWELILAACLVAAISSYYVTRQQPPVYQARTTLLIGRSVYQPNPSSNDLWMGQQLASFYADIVQREGIRTAAMKALGLSWLPDYYARSIPNSQFIEIIVSDNIPVRAQAVSNELANQLINQTPGNTQPQEQKHEVFIDKQLNDLEDKIQQTVDDINKKQDELAGLTSARQINEAQQEINALETKLTTLQTNYATLMANSQQGALNTLSVIEAASLPVVPVGPQKGLMILLSTAVGFGLATLAAYLLEYLDDTLKDSDDISHMMGVPVIGYISEMGKGKGEGAYIAEQPRSVIAEAFRSLRTNLEFAGVDKPLKTVFVSSSGGEEGKSSVAINLATIIAQGGKRVVLLDADMRRPSIHRYLGLSNQKGLSDVFRGALELTQVINYVNDHNLMVITGGTPPPNPAELLSSKKMDSILRELGRIADIVIIDGTPFVVSDAVILSKKVDGVLLVIRYGFTRKESAQAVIEQLDRVGARVLGVVFNRIPRVSENYYLGYRYYEYNAEGSRDIKKPAGLLSRIIHSSEAALPQADNESLKDSLQTGNPAKTEE